MYWSTQRKSVPLSELGYFNTIYLGTTQMECDPSLIWGTTVETDALEAFIAEQRQQTGLLISPAHVLVRAVAESLRRHPEMNRRVIGRRVYQYDGVNVTMPMLNTRSGEADTVFLRNADKMSLAQISETLWEEARAKALQVAAEKRHRTDLPAWKLRLRELGREFALLALRSSAWLGFLVYNWIRMPTIRKWQRELTGAGAFVNYLGFAGAPPLVVHKISHLPLNAYSVCITMGRSDPQPVVENGQIVIRKQAHLFVRADHRYVDGNQTGEFVATLRKLLMAPHSLLSTTEVTPRPQSRAA
ncbi:MAG: 2-oxo acid dehydrogenase subunit E2 [Planctomycetes bacterium]|nr:2-oxo acid dehydrogenase subunit E2 [Planctomycetota bacterium]